MVVHGKNLRTPCCTQVTKTKDSYLYQKSFSAETRWCAKDWVTSTDYGQNYIFWLYSISIPRTPSYLCKSIFLIKVTVLGFSYLFTTQQTTQYRSEARNEYNITIKYVSQKPGRQPPSWLPLTLIEVGKYQVACLTKPADQAIQIGAFS